jgi:hypothetical protein
VRFGAPAAVSPGQDAIRAELGQMVEEDMKISLKVMMAAAIGVGGLGLAAKPASAMPVSGLNPALATQADSAQGIESVRWVCDPYGGCQRVRHWRRYGYGWGPGYGLYGPGPWWPYGYAYPCPWPGPYGWGYYC